MKNLNTIIENFFKNTESGLDVLKEQVYDRLKEIVRYPYKREEFRVNDDLTVDYTGGREVGINQEVEELGVQFNECNGTFDLIHCENLKTLKGSPRVVVGMFRCSFCDSLKTLEGSPEKVYGIFTCEGSKNLISLKGAPREVNQDFICSYCSKLKTLEGSPKFVGRNFQCESCENLVSLKGITKNLKRELWLLRCTKLENLKYIPQNLWEIDLRYCKLDIDITNVNKNTNLLR